MAELVMSRFNFIYKLVLWAAQRVECWTCYQLVVVSNLLGAKLSNNLGQVVDTYVPLSPSSITWYWPMGGDALRL